VDVWGFAELVDRGGIDGLMEWTRIGGGPGFWGCSRQSGHITGASLTASLSLKRTSHCTLKDKLNALSATLSSASWTVHYPKSLAKLAKIDSTLVAYTSGSTPVIRRAALYVGQT